MTCLRLTGSQVFFFNFYNYQFLSPSPEFQKYTKIHNVATKEGELTSLLQLQCSLPIILTTAVEQLYQPQEGLIDVTAVGKNMHQ